MRKLICLIIGLLPCVCYAATYYIAPNGSDSNNGTSAAPWATFSVAFSRMSGGDTLIIRDGVYTQQLRNPPDGTAGNYTKIKAENNFRVTVRYPDALAIRDSDKYIQIEGIKFDGGSGASGQAGTLLYVDHIKILRCSFTGSTTSDWNVMTFSLTGCSYVTVEECWAWGTGRYKFLAYQSNHIIFRRCVARHDYHPSTQCAGFTRYDSPNIEFQNCIVIDSGTADNSNGGWYGGIWNENNALVDTTGKNLGCIMLNMRGGMGIQDGKIKGTRTMENCIIWDAPIGMTIGNYLWGTNDAGYAYLNHLTVGAIYDYGGWGAGQGVWDTLNYSSNKMNASEVTNSIITQCAVSGLNSTTKSDYNCLYGNAANYSGVSAGAHDITSNAALKYIVRVESGSSCKGTASDGRDRGATVIKRYGVAETLWGETGYETLTDVDLWPFPNEAEIRADFRTWNGGYVSGTRGFCADGETLTHYIMNYLGNGNPYGEGGTATTKSSTSGNVLLSGGVVLN